MEFGKASFNFARFDRAVAYEEESLQILPSGFV
jgi:hypothetical protein